MASPAFPAPTTSTGPPCSARGPSGGSRISRPPARRSTPATFLALCAAANALGHLLLGWGVRAVVGVFVGQVVGALVAAALFVLIAQHLFGGRAGFEPTFRVVAYAGAPLVIFWVPFFGLV